MATLPDVINKGRMISVNVDTQQFVDVLRRLNEIVKSHSEHFAQMDLLVGTFCTKKEMYDVTDSLKSEIESLTIKSREVIDKSQVLATEARLTREKLTDMIDSKCDEILISTNMAYKNSNDIMEQKIDNALQTAKEAIIMSRENKNECMAQKEVSKEVKSNVQILGERIHHVNTEFIKFVNEQKAVPGSSVRQVVRVVQQGAANGEQNLVDETRRMIEQLEEKTKEQITAVQSSVADLVNDRLESIQKSLEVAVMHPLSDNSPKLNEVWAVTSQNRAALLNAMTEQSLLGRRVDVLQQMIDNLLQNSSNLESPNRPMLSSIMAHQNAANRAGMGVPLDNDIRTKEHLKLASTVDDLGGKMEGALQDILRIKNAVNRNEKDVRDVVLAIIDEFKLIRTNASGLENLPPLNLATCVPSFFNNPSFTYGRIGSGSESPTESERSDEVGHGPRRGRDPSERRRLRRSQNSQSSDDENCQSAQIESPRYITNKISGLLHLVSRPEPRSHEIQQPNVQTLKDHDINKSSKERLETGSQSSARSSASKKSEKQTTDKSQTAATLPHKVEQSVIHVIDRQGLDELKQDMVQFHKNKDELMSSVDRKVDRDMVEKLFNKFRVIISRMNDRIDDVVEEIHKYATQADVQNIVKQSQQSSQNQNSTRKTPLVPVQSFGGKGDFVIGEDGVAFIKESERCDDLSELPPLKERKRTQ